MAENSSNWINEELLAVELNVPRSVLRDKRASLPVTELEYKKNGVHWLRTAAARLAGELGLQWPAPTEPPPAPATETLTVVSQAANPHIVNCRRASGELVCVRVMDNKKYVPQSRAGTPMTLPAQKSTAGNWWLLVGREPRWTGQW